MQHLRSYIFSILIDCDTATQGILHRRDLSGFRINKNFSSLMLVLLLKKKKMFHYNFYVKMDKKSHYEGTKLTVLLIG